jgi:hypothetical protein
MKFFNRLQFILISGLVTGFFSCGQEKNPLQSLQEKTMPVSYEIGQKWLYKRAFINVGLSRFMDFPDTIPGYAFFEVVDTQTIDLIFR